MKKLSVLVLALLTVLVASGTGTGLPGLVAAQGDPLVPCAEALTNYTPVVGTDSYPTPIDMPTW